MERNLRRERGRAIWAFFFIVAGIGHFVAPAAYMKMMPPWVPEPELMILLSGIAEVAGGVGLMIPKVRMIAVVGLIAMLAAILPANVQMLLNHRADGGSKIFEIFLWLRLPFQLVIMNWIWKLRRP